MTGYKVTDLSPMVEYDANDLVAVVDVSTNTTRKYKLGDLSATSGTSGNLDTTNLAKLNTSNTFINGSNFFYGSQFIANNIDSLEFRKFSINRSSFEPLWNGQIGFLNSMYFCVIIDEDAPTIFTSYLYNGQKSFGTLEITINTTNPNITFDTNINWTTPIPVFENGNTYIFEVIVLGTNTNITYVNSQNYERQSITSCVLDSDGNPKFMSLFGDGDSSALTTDIHGDGSCIFLFTLDSTLNDNEQSHSLTQGINPIIFTPALFNSQGCLFGDNTSLTFRNSQDTIDSVSFWFNTSSNNAQEIFKNEYFSILINPFLNTIDIHMIDAGAPTYTIPYPINIDEWHNILINNDNNNTNYPDIYLDSVLVYTLLEVATPTTNSITFGGGYTASQPQFYGIIDQIRVFNKKLSLEEILRVNYEELGIMYPKLHAPLNVTIANGNKDLFVRVSQDLTGTAILGGTNYIFVNQDGTLFNTAIKPIVSRGFNSDTVPVLNFNFEQSNNYSIDMFNHILQCYSGTSITDIDKVFGNNSLNLISGHAEVAFPNLDLNTFTLRMKIKFNNTGLNQMLFSADEDFKFLKVMLINNKLTYFGNNSGVNTWDLTSDIGYSGNTTISYGVWYDLEIVNTGSSFISFINGIKDTSMNTVLKLSKPNRLRFGSSVTNDDFMNGFIDDLEVLPYAKHIDVFTPSLIPSEVPSIYWFNLNDYIMRYGTPSNWVVKPCIHVATVDIYGNGSIINPVYINPNIDIKGIL